MTDMEPKARLNWFGGVDTCKVPVGEPGVAEVPQGVEAPLFCGEQYSHHLERSELRNSRFRAEEERWSSFSEATRGVQGDPEPSEQLRRAGSCPGPETCVSHPGNGQGRAGVEEMGLRAPF